MKKETGNKIKLGIFVSVSLLLFISGIYFIGQRQQLFNNTFNINSIFKNINGLQVGNNVRFSGINVGIVENIQQITDSTVKVDMLIDESSKKFIKKNAQAIISSDGLMGNKIVAIIPGAANNEEIANNDMIEAITPVSMEDILAKVKTTIDNTEQIAGDLAMIVQNIREGKGAIGKLFSDSVFAKNLDKAMINIKQGTGGFKENMDAASHTVLLRGYFKKKENDKNKNDKK